MSTADEIKKLKELLDEGVLSQEEFDSEKSNLLNENEEEAGDSKEDIELDNLEEASIDPKTGEASCPKCGSTNLKARRNKAARFTAVATLGLSNTLVPKTAVRCKSCNNLFSRREIRK